MHSDELVVLKSLELLRPGEKMTMNATVQLHQAGHFGVLCVTGSIFPGQHIIQVYPALNRYDRCIRSTKDAISMLQMLKTIGQITHIPMHPKFVTPVSNKAVKVPKKLQFNFIEVLLNILPLNTQLLSDSMRGETDSLLSSEMGNAD
ncbi:hypothetical protein AYJ57_05175 [Salipiger sp. CCB-MM3]|nr:hypothetical protein AYJ57_05175 [Salipiger sp. CCB-MM3]